MKNSITFIDPNKTDYDEPNDVKIQVYSISAYLVEIDSRLINIQIFYRTITFSLEGEFKSIDENMKQGIKWIQSINWDVRVDLNNQSDIEIHT